MNNALDSLARFGPETVLTIGLLVVVLADSVLAGALRARVVRALTAVSLLGALLATAALAREAPGAIFSGLLAVDPMGVFFKAVLLLASLLVVLVFDFENSRELHGLGSGEFHSLLLALTFSSLLLASANDILMLYLALEMVSITSYVLVAYIKGDRGSNEAALKYLLFGAVASGAMLYGFSLLYGLTGATGLPQIQAALRGGFDSLGLMALALIVLLVTTGLGFKVAAVPFHFWCPDAYQGAPAPVAALLSVGPKAAGLAAMLRFFSLGLPTAEVAGVPLMMDWPLVLMLVSALTMTVGNLAAITQTDLKRLLAYSSIAQAGFMLMGIVAANEAGRRGLLVYVLVYVVMNLGAFLAVTLLHRHEGSFDLRDYHGAVKRQPLIVGALVVFLLSLTGIPPLVGFMGKFFVFAAVLESGPRLTWFAVCGAINAAISAWYYLRVIRVMLIDPEDQPQAPSALRAADRFWLWALAAANVLPLLFWEQVDGWVRGSVALLASR